jgi:hypothetical protein
LPRGIEPGAIGSFHEGDEPRQSTFTEGRFHFLGERSHRVSGRPFAAV